MYSAQANKQIQQIMHKLNFGREEAEMYELFAEQADFTTGIIMYGDLQLRIKEYWQEIVPAFTKEQTRELYHQWSNIFSDKDLIQTVIDESGHPYPQLIGYNPYNDPELYVFYRKKGEQEWTGRMSKDLITQSLHDQRLTSEPFWSIKHGYEFKDEWVNQLIKN